MSPLTSLLPHPHDPSLGAIFSSLDIEAASWVFSILRLVLTASSLVFMPHVQYYFWWTHMSLPSLKPSVAFIVLRKFPHLLTVFLHVICAPYSFSCHIPSSPALHTCVSFSRNIVHPIPPWQTPTHHSDLSFGFTFPSKTSLTINSKHGASRKSWILSIIALAKHMIISLLLLCFFYWNTIFLKAGPYLMCLPQLLLITTTSCIRIPSAQHNA